VLDLCTGSGVSLTGLRRPGRTVLGIDVSLAMLRVAAEEQYDDGWAPGLTCADGFHLPLRDGALDAVTVAFGIRNLRPRPEALAEIARVLASGGRLIVLEAAAPAPGPLAPFTRAWIRHAIPVLGRLSPDPTAYKYLAESIFEFGSGAEFEADLAKAGFRVVASRAFLFGASQLWVAERGPVIGQKTTEPALSVQGATPASGEMAQAGRREQGLVGEASAWRLVGALTSTALVLTLAWALVVWANMNAGLPLSPPQRFGGWVLLAGGLGAFGARCVLQWLAWSAVRGGGARPR
jgi:demethylmenaquinone methyltransferase/2-methoxy-6-polyprenyl-1,4-benzoquinol methylase